MKYALLLIAIISNGALACIVIPVQLEASHEHGFMHKEKASEIRESCIEISVIAPLVFLGKKFELGIFGVMLNNKLVSKYIRSSINEDGVPEFLGYVSKESGFAYSVSFLYGEGRCKAYEFTATKKTNKSYKWLKLIRRVNAPLNLASHYEKESRT